MSYTLPVAIAAFSEEDVSKFETTAGYRWCVYMLGWNDIVTHARPPLHEGDPEAELFTQRTALKFAADHNAFIRQEDADRQDPRFAIVLHHGELWLPNPVSDGAPGEYCEWFDSDASGWFCNLCLEPITGSRCATCAPMSFPGLMRVTCESDHPAVFMHAMNQWEGYGPTCHYCIAKWQREDDAVRTHAGHRRMYRRLSKWRLLPALKRLGLVKSWHWASGGPAKCCGCVSVQWRWSV